MRNRSGKGGCEPSAAFFGEPYDDTLRPTDVGQPILILVLLFADDLGPVGARARNYGVDVIDGEHDATEAERVHRGIHGPKPDRVGRMELVQLDTTVTIRRPQHRKGGPDILEPDETADQRPLDSLLAFKLEAQLEEERLDGFEIVDNDEDVVHPLDRHVFP